MRNLPAILLMFAISLGFFIAGWWWIAPAMHVFSGGERSPAQIDGMLRLRADGADLITGLRSEIQLVCRNGDRLSVIMKDFKVEDLQVAGAETGEKSEPLSARFSEEASAALLQRIARGDVDEIVRVLRREARLGQEDGIVGLTKREVATGSFGLRHPPVSFTWDGQGTPIPIFSDFEKASDVAERVVSIVRFGTHVVQAGGGTHKLTEPAFARESYPAALPAGAENFVMFDGGHITEYRPVLTYFHDGKPMASLADLGKIKGESSAFRLFSPAYVYIGGGGRPLMVADLEALGANDSVLSWFSSASEAVFSRWVYPAFFWSFGLYTLLFACIALSLYRNPGKALHDS